MAPFPRGGIVDLTVMYCFCTPMKHNVKTFLCFMRPSIPISLSQENFDFHEF